MYLSKAKKMLDELKPQVICIFGRTRKEISRNLSRLHESDNFEYHHAQLQANLFNFEHLEVAYVR